MANEPLDPRDPRDPRESAYDRRAVQERYGGRPVAIPESPDYLPDGRRGGGDTDEGVEISLRDYWRVLVKRRWQVLTIAAVVVAGTLVYTLLDTPLYRATTVLQIDNNALKVLKTEGLEAVDPGTDYLGTQLEILKSRSIAERTVRELSLVGDRAFEAAGAMPNGFSAIWAAIHGHAQPAAAAGTLEQREARAVAQVQKNLTVTPVRNARLVQVTFVSADPNIATKVANGVARVYMQSNLDRRIDNTQFARTFLEDRLQELKLKLEDSERALIKYSQDERIVNVDEYASLAEKNLAQLTGALAAAQSDRMRAEARAQQADDLDSLSLESLKSPVLESLRQKLVELRAQYESKRSVYKPDFPEMLALARQINEVESQIKAEKKAYQRAATAEYRAGKANEALIKKQINELRDEVLDLQGRGIQYNILKREADTNRQLYDGLLQRYKEIGVAGDVGANNVAMVDVAQRGVRFKPDLGANLTKGVLGGLFLGMLLAFLIEMLDDTLKTPEDIERQIRMPVVGIVPKIPAEVFDEVAADAKSSFAEAYRSLRTALQYATDQGAPKILMITSAVAGEGKTTSSTMLAQQFSQLGLKVLLIDTDLRKPSIHKRFDLANEVGLSTLLSGQAEEAAIFQATADPNLTVITSGDKPPNPAELLATERFRALLTHASAHYDQIILDCAPLLGLADVPTIASYADGVLMVIEAAETRVGVVRATLKRLVAARARVLGAILVKFDSRVTGYGYGYGYHYADHYYYYSHYGAYGSQKPESARRKLARGAEA